jgi:hypothetical protein
VRGVLSRSTPMAVVWPEVLLGASSAPSGPVVCLATCNYAVVSFVSPCIDVYGGSGAWSPLSVDAERRAELEVELQLPLVYYFQVFHYRDY